MVLNSIIDSARELADALSLPFDWRFRSLEITITFTITNEYVTPVSKTMLSKLKRRRQSCEVVGSRPTDLGSPWSIIISYNVQEYEMRNFSKVVTLEK